jgi:hypothetical protein
MSEQIIVYTEQLKQLVQQAFDAGRRFSIEAVAKATNDTIGQTTVDKLLESATKPQAKPQQKVKPIKKTTKKKKTKKA